MSEEFEFIIFDDYNVWKFRERPFKRFIRNDKNFILFKKLTTSGLRILSTIDRDILKVSKILIQKSYNPFFKTSTTKFGRLWSIKKMSKIK